MFLLQTLSLFWISLISLSCAARILGVFQLDVKSHFNFHETMMKSLLAAGHQVTAVAPMSSTFSHENYTIINYKNRRDDDESRWAFATRKKLTSLSLYLAALNGFELDCRSILKLEKQINVSENPSLKGEMLVIYFGNYEVFAKNNDSIVRQFRRLIKDH